MRLLYILELRRINLRCYEQIYRKVTLHYEFSEDSLKSSKNIIVSMTKECIIIPTEYKYKLQIIRITNSTE